ncbi:MAG: copper-binding protein [Candidatus Rokubacteria bacterium]|nr:copper-binding protein [Candidatus Rokubacteria bacterium]
MRLWKAIVLLDVALALGLGGGYLWWARELPQLDQELAATRRAAEARAAADGSWRARGIVRLVQRSQGAVWLTHETIPGVMDGMTMPFPAADEAILEGLAPGDPVRFTLTRREGRLVVVAIEKEGPP